MNNISFVSMYVYIPCNQILEAMCQVIEQVPGAGSVHRSQSDTASVYRRRTKEDANFAEPIAERNSRKKSQHLEVEEDLRKRLFPLPRMWRADAAVSRECESLPRALGLRSREC